MEKLIFAYNAESGILNSVKDLLHKNFSPETYACRLCALTYDNFGMIREWKDFTRSLNIPTEFLHRDELKSQYGLENILLPVAFVQNENKEIAWKKNASTGSTSNPPITSKIDFDTLDDIRCYNIFTKMS